MSFRWGWVGAATPTGFTVAARAGAGQTLRLAVSTATDLSSPTWFGPVTADTDGFGKLVATGLSAATRYYWRVEVDGTLAGPTDCTCKTMPATGAAFGTFKIGLWSCTGNNSNTTNSASNHPFIDAMRAKGLDLAVSVGDLHYYNPVPNTLSEHQRGYGHIFEQNPRYNELLRKVPAVHVWSDHDYCGGDVDGNGNSDGTASGRPAACTAYRQVVPHLPLVKADGTAPNGAIHRKTKIGRVHMIVSDLRSCRSPNTDAHSSSKTMMGADQKAWWKQAMLDAKADGSPIILWAQETLWDRPRVANPTLGGAATDGWGSFDDERVELANFLRDNDIPPLVILEGDIHMAAAKIRANDYSSNGRGPKPMLCHSSLADHNVPLTAGSGYDVGPFSTDRGYYGVVTINDDGTTVTVTFDIYQVDTTTAVETLKGTISRTFKPTTAPDKVQTSIMRNGAGSASVQWPANTDPTVRAFRVYKNGTLVSEVSASTTSAPVPLP